MSVDVRSHAPTRASPEHASRTILSPEALPLWFRGARIVSTDSTWPAAGARMRWKAQGATFDATVVENHLPHDLMMDVRTPSGLSRITHTFEPRSEGGTMYEKRVEARIDKHGGLGDWMTRQFLQGAVRREVARAASVADDLG